MRYNSLYDGLLLGLREFFDQIDECRGHRRIDSSKPARNQALNITGLLVYLNGSTIHIMEGDKKCVEHEFAIIREDPRHCHVLVMYRSPVPYRLFEEWYLNYKTSYVSRLDQVEQLSTIWHEELYNPAMSLLRSFCETNYRN